MSLFTDITLGQFYPVDSYVHRLDPRTKLIVALLFMTVLLITNQLIEFGVAALLIALCVHASRVPVIFIVRNLRPFLWLFVLTLLIHIFLSDDTATVRVPLINVPVSGHGVLLGIAYSLRLALLIVFASLLTLTTSPIEITDALEKMLSPLNRFRLPTHDLIMMMTLSLRFIPTLMMEAERLKNAQLSRGVSFKGNVFKRIRSIIPLVLPLFLSVFRRADELAIAMDARCYTGGEGRTRYKELVFDKNDYIVLSCTIFITIAFVVIKL